MIKKIIILFAVIFSLLVFYISFKQHMDKLLSERDDLSKKYEKVYVLVETYKLLSKTETVSDNKITAGLLSYIQDTSNKLNIKITSIKPIPGDTEKISVVYQKISFNSSLSIVNTINSVSNIKIVNFSLTKRYDDQDYMNLDLQVEKL
jgi:hypothetical protein